MLVPLPTTRGDTGHAPSTAAVAVRPWVLAAALLLATPAVAAVPYNVGSFTKSTSGAPVTQNVAHGLGQTPKALILWTDGKTNTTLGSDFRFAFGVSDGTTDKSVGISSANGLTTTSANRRIASKALTIIDSSGTTVAEADLQSFDGTNFTLNWTTNNGSAYVIHFVALGGPRLSAKVLGWTMPTSTGNHGVTGVGFQPDLVITAHGGAGLTSSPPSTTQHAALGLSAFDATGGQWAEATFSTDAVTTTDASRYLRSDQALVAVGGSQSKSKEASWVSMDTDGFTLSYTTANSSAGQAFSLALRGLQAQVGTFTKSTGGAPASQGLTGIRFTPVAVLLSGVQNTSTTSISSHARFGIGASNVTTEGGSAFQDTDALGTSSVDGVDKTTKVFMKVNNNTPSLDAEADVTSLDTSGFTLSWTTNDAVATEVAYVTLAAARRVVVVGRAGRSAAPHGSRSPSVR